MLTLIKTPTANLLFVNNEIIGNFDYMYNLILLIPNCYSVRMQFANDTYNIQAVKDFSRTQY